ncbi:MAG: ComEC/Rec2 family competence protein [Patescibacteria group bacterium]
MFNQLFNKFKINSVSRSMFVIGFLLLFIIGAFLSDLVKIDIWWLAGIFVGLLIVLIVFWTNFFWRLVLISFLGFLLGFGYFRIWDNWQREITLPFSQEILFEGQIVSHPDFLSNNSRYTVIYQNSKIQVVANRYPEYQYGDNLKIKGILKEPNDYQFHQGILGVIYNPVEIVKINNSGNIFKKTIYQIRDRFEEILNKTLSEPYASFAAGLILGSKRNIPDSLMSDFNRTGTTHVIAVSGFNVTIMIIYLGLILGIISRKLKFWGSVSLILMFVIMTGAAASVVRAGLIASLIVWGQYEGRRVNLFILLLLVASLMLLLNPYMLKFDISFQLSFLAFIGLVYLSPVLRNLKIIKWLPDTLKLILTETLAAQIMVLPILIYYFGRVSLISPIVNILILWLIPTAMLFVFLIGISGFIWMNFGQIVGYAGWLFLKYIIVVVETFSKISWASLELKLHGWWWMALFYGLIGLWFYKNRQRRFDESAKT